MAAERWKRHPEWLDDARREPRWLDVKPAVAYLGDLECAAMTGDVSLGGVRLALVGHAPRPGERIQVEVAFEDRLIEVNGRVAYALRRPWGCVIGVQTEDSPQAFLARRYFAAEEAPSASA